MEKLEKDDLTITIDSIYFNKKFTYKYDEKLFEQLECDTGIKMYKEDDSGVKTDLFMICGDNRKYAVLNYEKNIEDKEEAEYDAEDLEKEVLSSIPLHVIETLKDNFTTLYFTNRGMFGMSDMYSKEIAYGISENSFLIPILGTDPRSFLWNIAPIIDEAFYCISDSVEFFDLYLSEKDRFEKIELNLDIFDSSEKPLKLNYYTENNTDYFNKAFELYYSNTEELFDYCPRTYEFMKNLDEKMKKNYLNKESKKNQKIKNIGVNDDDNRK